MRNNKVLAAAITATLLGSLSAVEVNAGIDKVIYPDTAYTPPPMTVATEVIKKGLVLASAGAVAGDECSGALELFYITESEIPGSASGVVSISLVDSSGKAVFAYTNLLPTSATGVVANSVLEVTGVTTDGKATAFTGNLVVSGGGIGEPNLDITIQTATGAKLNAGSTLAFAFCVDDVNVLQTSGQTIGLDVTFGGSTSSTTLFSGKSGAGGKVTPGDDDGLVKVDIGGEAGAKKFTGSSLGETTAILGEICLNKVNGVYGSNLKDPFKPFDEITAMNFSITGAPFNASIGHEMPTTDTNPYSVDQVDKVMVFLELDGKDGFSETRGADIPATTVELTTATFEITNDDPPGHLQALLKVFETENNLASGLQGACVDVIFKVSGDTAIQTFGFPPVGTLTVTFNESVEQPYPGNMNHIQKSGTFCTCYNIPGPQSIENSNIRVTNKSALPDGSLYGTLELPDGTRVFDYVSLGTIGPNQTLHLNTKLLEEKAVAAGWTTGWQRATIDLETNLEDAEIMCLVRDNDVTGAPLQNMSVGASGNGCGR